MANSEEAMGCSGGPRARTYHPRPVRALAASSDWMDVGKSLICDVERSLSEDSLGRKSSRQP
jgi:hypothetical protein